MRFTSIGIAALALAGCQANLTLEEAQARCAQKGGLLTIIYTQQITASGISSPVGAPGECISPDRFEVDATPAK